MELASTELTWRIAPDEPILLEHVKSAACWADRPVRPLHLQSLLQLPRLADINCLAPLGAIEELLAKLRQELPVRSEWLVPNAGPSPRILRFHAVDSNTARDVMSRFHYLRSPRIDGYAYGLSTRSGRLVALCVLSPLDVERLAELLTAAGRSSDSARVVSRVFVFEGAPDNSISYMLSRVAREERNCGVTDLVTYVNPNMGFSGSSYLASNWRLLGTEPGTQYRYLDERYITDRELASRFGYHDDQGYSRLLGARFAISVMPLKPLLVFHTTLI